jgi:hypothetical protein
MNSVRVLVKVQRVVDAAVELVVVAADAVVTRRLLRRLVDAGAGAVRLRVLRRCSELSDCRRLQVVGVVGAAVVADSAAGVAGLLRGQGITE